MIILHSPLDKRRHFFVAAGAAVAGAVASVGANKLMNGKQKGGGGGGFVSDTPIATQKMPNRKQGAPAAVVSSKNPLSGWGTDFMSQVNQGMKIPEPEPIEPIIPTTSFGNDDEDANPYSFK